jgi:hypothetical protein
MAAPYDYVQIVTDQDWGLVGIIPNNGSIQSGNSFTSMEKNAGRKTIEVPKIEATVINKRRSHIISTNNNSMITRAELINPTDIRNNVLSGIEYIQSKTNIGDTSDLLFGEISNLAGIGNRDNILVGFGR